MESLSQLYRSETAFQQSMKNYDEAVNKWSIQPESVFAETRFGKTHLLRIGDDSKPPFVFFHGWNGNSSGLNTELDIPRLAQYFQLHFIDTIGQSGKSAPARPDTSDQSYGEWTTDVFDALHLENIHLSGISGGGYLSLKACVQAPEKINKAFLMVPGGLIDLSRINLRFIMGAIPAAMGFEWGGRFFIRRMVSPDFKNEAKIHEMGEGMKNVLSGIIPVNGPKALSDDDLKLIQTPIYIVVGKYDIAVHPMQTIKRAERLIPNVTTRMVDAGHMITIEKQDWLMDEMLRFFDVM